MPADMPAEAKRPAIAWYRSPVDPIVLRRLYERSDVLGLLQTLGYLGLLALTGAAAFYSAPHWPVGLTLLLVFLHGTFYAFYPNAVHELGHDTVFKTRWLNMVFVHVFAFLGWMNHRMFAASHVRHHRSTLHPPDDLEVVLPTKITLKDFLKFGLVNVRGPLHVLRFTLRIARGRFEGPWELTLFPETQPEKQRGPVAWARTLLIGHALLVLLALSLKLWLLPVLITFAPFYGGWLFFLCNNTQHVGLQDNVTDFRQCCRTFIPNPFVRFLYWQMNYHTEHHMYVGVPCYHLGKLHQLVEADLPPSPRGLLATWREIGAILKRQATDPTYQHIAPRPVAEGGETVRPASG